MNAADAANGSSADHDPALHPIPQKRRADNADIENVKVPPHHLGTAGETTNTTSAASETVLPDVPTIGKEIETQKAAVTADTETEESAILQISMNMSGGRLEMGIDIMNPAIAGITRAPRAVVLNLAPAPHRQRSKHTKKHPVHFLTRTLHFH